MNQQSKLWPDSGPCAIEVEGEAVFSRDRKARHLLSRTWDRTRPMIGFCLLNPSKAGATENDTTLTRCMGFARSMAMGGLWLVNLSDYVATDFKECLAAGFPESQQNRPYIARAIAQSYGGQIVCGWGNGGVNLERGAEVRKFIEDSGGTPLYFRLTKLGQPEHPLYLPAYLRPKI